MSVKSIDLCWIVVKDFKKAVAFYTDVLGMKLLDIHEEFGWAELVGSDGGAYLGIAAENADTPVKPGAHAIVTMTVQDIDKTVAEMTKKGAKMVGDVQEVPGHVKLQMFQDLDGNYCQLCQKLDV
ncbi:MAG: VOC family protein [Chlamydiales bacterium]|nr:VOC family protein [Chlamydiales bacterium]